MEKLKRIKAYKLQLNQLGYIVDDGLKGLEFYRSQLRSGKTETKVLNTGDRLYQYNELLQRYFNLKYSHVNIKGIPSYKKLIAYCAYGVSDNYFKILDSVAKKLIELNHLEVTLLCTGDKIINDKFNGNLYHIHNKDIYLVNGNKTFKINYK